MGGVIGGLIFFILNYNRGEVVFVNDGIYIGFMCFMVFGGFFLLVILLLSEVIRDDGSECIYIKYLNVFNEVVEIVKLFLNWKMFLIVLVVWGSNFFYIY